MLVDPRSFHPVTFGWLFFSGLIGFGIGDVGLYLALTRIGARLTVLINFSLATICGALGDWLWLGDVIEPLKWIPISLILAGLAIALLAARSSKLPRIGSYAVGLFAAVVAGLGQGFGSTISRVANDAAEVIGMDVGGISQAFQRVLAGFLFGALVLLFLPRRGRPLTPGHHPGWWKYLVAAALFGPVLGVSCFQHALTLQPSGIVLAIVATSPLILIPVSAVLEQDAPTPHSIVGSIIAVAGVIGLTLFDPIEAWLLQFFP